MTSVCPGSQEEKYITSIPANVKEKLGKAENSGHQDAQLLSQRRDFIEHQPPLMNRLPLSVKACIMEPHTPPAEEEEQQREEEQEQLEEEEREIPEGETDVPGYCSLSLGWSLSSLERALYLSLPAWVQAALLCNIMAQIGLVGFHDTFLARLISYLLLPYTLPTFIFFDFTYRLLLSLKHIPEFLFWIWQDLKQIVQFVTRITLSSLKKNLIDRFLPSFHLNRKVKSPPEGSVPPESSLVRRRSTLRVQFSSTGCTSSTCTDPDSDTDAQAFSFLLDLGLELDSHPDTQSLHPCLPSSERDDENGATLATPQTPARAGAEGEVGGARKNINQQPQAVQG